MPNLWVQAVSGGPWFEARNRGDISAVNRHRAQVAAAHGVPGFRAGIALRPIYQALGRSTYGGLSPKDAGFASGPKQDEWGDVLPWSDEHPLNEHENWHHVPVASVNLKQPIHATQDGVGAKLVAHNLFHPGKLPPVAHPGSEGEREHHVGNPDLDPDSFAHEGRSNAVNADEASKVPRFYRDAQGAMHVADGHHQVAAALLLGKPSIEGRVWDESNPPEGVR